MIDRNHDLPVTRQCRILRLARSTAYYQPPPVAEADLALMRRIDELHLDFRWRDNVFVERPWKSVKSEEVYLKAYHSVPAAKVSLGAYLNFYNTRRSHQSLDGKTPDEIYFRRAAAGEEDRGMMIAYSAQSGH